LPDETREIRRVRALFISDVHLGMKATRVAQLIDFLRWHDADVIYLVGDIVDGWRLAKSWHWPPEYDELTKLIIASDPHSPDGVRANGTPTNVDAFAKAFGCKDGDAMVNSGDKKVVIW